MSLTITSETKNDLIITPENKPASTIVADAAISFDEAKRTFAEPGLITVNETKINITITDENKS